MLKALAPEALQAQRVPLQVPDILWFSFHPHLQGRV